MPTDPEKQPDNNLNLEEQVPASQQPVQQASQAPSSEQDAGGPLHIQPQSTKKSKSLILGLVLVLLLLAIYATYVLAIKKSTPANNPVPITKAAAPRGAVQSTSHFIFTDNQNKKITVTDKNAKPAYSINYSSEPYASFIAADRAGDLLFLLSNSVSDSNEQYLLTNKNGEQQDLSQQAQKVLLSANGDRGTSTIFLQSAAKALLTTCTYQKAADNNKCDLEAVDLKDGSTQIFVETDAPQASDTGDALFALRGLSGDGQNAYLEVAGPTSLGQDADAIYKVDLSTKKTTKLANVPIDWNDVNLSPDGKKLVYVVQTSSSSPTILHLVDLATAKNTAVTWIKDSISEGSIIWHWSPDDTKVLFEGFQEEPITPTQLSDIGPTTYAYLDTKTATITNLQTIQDSAHYIRGFQSWLDNQNVVYEYNTTVDPHNFSNSSAQIYEQNITTKKATKLNISLGDLDQVVYY